MAVVVTALGKALQPTFDLINISLFYLLPVLISAARWGLWPSLFASLLGMLCFDYFFVPPFLSFTVHDIRHLLNFAIFLIVALVTGTLAARLRAQVDAARERERRLAALYTLSSRIAVETGMERVLQAVADMIAESVGIESAILVPGAPLNQLSMAVRSGGGEFLLEQKQSAVAQWAFEHGRQAGRGTGVLGDIDELFIPVTEGPRSLAILAVKPGAGQVLSSEQKKDLEAFASLAALAITRVRLTHDAEQTKWLLESEKLHKAILDAVSHDLRTPLSSIMGAVTGLLDEGDMYDGETKKTLLKVINEGGRRMNRFITNLLDMARIDSGTLRPKREWCDMLDITGVAVKEARGMLPEARFALSAPEELPFVEVDFGLVEQVLINLLENAVKYSPPGSTVSIDIGTRAGEMVVSVLDSSTPIPESERTLIFDKFHRLRSSRHVTGTGLGLSIAKAMIEAHGGRLWVEPGPGGGNAFIFALPVGGREPPSMPAHFEEEHER